MTTTTTSAAMKSKPTLYDLTKLPVIDSSFAECENCELESECRARRFAFAFRPSRFNGVMIVGEGPGHHEVAKGEPFVGRSGQLLRALLKAADLDRDECYLTNATLCKPEQGAKNNRDLHTAFPNAIYSCLPRLDAEIEAVKPKVIVAMGSAAMIALTGYEKTTATRKPFECPDCDNETRKIGPVVACSSRKGEDKCTWLTFEIANVPERCPNCSAKLKNLKPKLIKCSTCHGLKTRKVEVVSFHNDYRISDIAGGIFDASKLPSRYSAFGVKYVISTFHPAFLLRPPAEHSRAMAGQFAAEPVVKHLIKAKRLVDSRVDFRVTGLITDDPKTVLEYCYRSNVNLAVDIETEAFGVDDDGKPVQLDARDPWKVSAIRCVGIGSSRRSEALVVDTREASKDLVSALKVILEDPKIKKTFQNGVYDLTVMRRLWDIAVVGYADELMVAHHVLYPDEDHNLAHMAFSFLDVEVWKPPREVKGVQIHDDFDELALYNAKDILHTDAVREAMGVRDGAALPGGLIEREGLAEVYALDMKLQATAVEMHWRGLPLDSEALKRVGIEAMRRKSNALVQMCEIINDPSFDPNSSKALQFVLYDVAGPLRLVPPKRTATGLGSTSRDDLAKLTASPFVQALLEYKEHAKILSTYVESDHIKVKADGRIHPVWNVTGTRTGRWSSKKPNFQNWPKWLRACVVAPEGRMIVGADYSQLELRIMAALSGDEELIARCSNADESRKLEPECDPHSYVASLAFGKAFVDLDIDDPKHDKTNERCRCERCTRVSLRDLCKRIVYGLNYGAGPSTVLASIYAGGYSGPPLTLDMVIRTTRAFFKHFPSVLRWREKSLKRAMEKREIRSPVLNRRRIFPLGDVPATVVYNFPIQSGAADILNQQFVLLCEGLGSIDATAFPIAQVHDAVYFECDSKKAKRVAKLVTETLSCSTSLADDAPEMAFPASAKIGANWYEVS